MPPTPQPLSPTRLLAIRIALITLCAGGGLAARYYGLRHAQSYARMAKQPEEITAAQAFAVPLDQGPRWVRLKEPLQVNCDHALQELTNGVVDFTEYLGYDATGKYAFLIRYKGDTDCGGTQAVQWEGLLKSPPMYWWTTNKMPYPASEPVELQLQAKPTEELKEAVSAFVIVPMAIGLVAVFARARPLKPKSPQQQFQERAAASGR
jgi:hypothetical protein